MFGKRLLLLALAGLFAIDLHAQDTTIVQTLTFSDITKRRDTWAFPDSTHTYRKVLMYYTLKCDAATTHDGYACGEWDYLTYTYLYDKRGLMDSTYRTGPSFTLNGNAADTAYVSWAPIYDYYQSYQYTITHNSVISFDSAMVGTGTATSAAPLLSSEPSGRSQFLFRAAELSAAGLSAGDISGLRLDLAIDGSELRNLRIGMKHSTADTLRPDAPESGFQTVYLHHTDFSGTGWQSLQFPWPFTYNGSDNIVVEISYEGVAGTDNELRGTATPWASGIYAAGDEYCLDFAAGGQYLNLGSGPQIQGNAPRTIEAWAYARAFNGGGIFQAGATGSTGKDFSLRTMGTDDLWRVQCWGQPDFDVTLNGSKDAWHHYAVVFDGATTYMYFDGQLAGSEPYPLNTGANDLWIGRWAGSYFDGRIDEVRVWDKALSPAVLDEWKDKAVTALHPDYADLRAAYDFNEGMGLGTGDYSAAGQPDGLLSGPSWTRVKGNSLFKAFEAATLRPNMVFEQGVYGSSLDSTLVTDSLMRPGQALILYENPAGGVKIPDNSAVHPSLPTDTLLGWDATGYAYIYDEITGTKVDSILLNADTVLYNQTLEWYSPTVVYEIGRFITPYGINLDLGPNGFTWVYDITDYAPLFRDSVELSAGNQQELIDLRFMLIEGTPPYDVKRLNKVWGEDARSYSYQNMDDDVVMYADTLPLDPDAVNFKLKTRLTGHGHESNTGNYPHCCEWKDNEHYLYVNGQQAAAWHIWQEPGCAQNPVFPQGGTWPGSREGWCPGELVKENDFDITDLVSGNEVVLDYDITPVPGNNTGMGTGNYVVTAHLMQYGEANHSLDAEVYDIVSPNSWEYYSRVNPICNDPKIVLRNAGNDSLTSVEIEYGVSGGTALTYTWNGNLAFMETEEVTLPVPDETFWVGDNQDLFTVSLSAPNNGTDAYADNDSYTVDFLRPDTMPNPIILFLKSNLLPNENSYTLTDMDGNVVHSRDNLASDWYYYDTLSLAPGCYTLELLDTGLDGLAYWAYPQQGNGMFRIMGPGVGVIKGFPSEFGYRIHYSFVVGDVVSVKDPGNVHLFEMYPNPGTGLFHTQIQVLPGDWDLSVYDAGGRRVWQERLSGDGNFNREVDLGDLPQGMYIARLSSGAQAYTKKLMIRK